MTNIDFNTTEYTAGNSALPEGKYTVIIEEATQAVSKAGSNYLKVRMQVVEGDRKGAVLFNNFNLWHAKEDVQKISRGQFSDMGRAMGLDDVNDTNEIVNKKFVVKVKVTEDTGYGEQNKVTSYSKVAGVEVGNQDDSPFG